MGATMSTEAVTIELVLHDAGDQTYYADAILQPPGGNADSILARDVRISLDLADLLARKLDPSDYGTALTQMLFGPSPLRDAWIKATTYVAATELPLRVRLRLDPDDDTLHALRWETLRDPETAHPLCFSRRILLSRYLDTGDLGRVPTLARSSLRAVVLVANPDDIEDFSLAPLQVADEVARTRAALAGIDLIVLARGYGQARASLQALTDTLEQGCPILCLMCHGALRRGEPTLYLEDEEGMCARVAGSTLVRAIADLPATRRPLLVVLAVCRSAGTGAEDVLSAIGPRLAKAGIAAVIGMQGDLPISTAERLLPRFFAALVEDGSIDRALALARAGLGDDEPWWMPALYLRTRDGRLWQVVSEQTDSQAVTSSLSVLSDFVQQRAEISAILAAYRADFEATSSQVTIVASYKLLHDLFQQLEDVTTLMHFAARRLPGDEQAWEDLEVNEPDARQLIVRLLQIASQSTFTDEASLWMRRLEQIHDDLRLSVEESDEVGLRRALTRLDPLLTAQLTRVNGGLVAAARTLRLAALAQALAEVRARTSVIMVNANLQSLLATLVSGVEALDRLAEQLSTLVRVHDVFQELDNELRGARARVEHDPQALADVWPDLKLLITRLIALNPSAYGDLAESATVFDHVLKRVEIGTMRRSFVRFAGHVSRSFHQTDHDLLTLCNDLQSLGLPLRSIVARLA